MQQLLALKRTLSKPDLVIGLILSSLFINLLELALPLTILQIYDRIIPNGATNTLVVLSVIVAGILIINAGLSLLRSQVATWADSKLSYINSCEAFKHIMHCKLHDFYQNGIGIYLSRLNSLDIIKEFYGGQSLVILLEIPFIILFLGLMYSMGGSIIYIPLAIQALLIISIFFYNKELSDITIKTSNNNQVRSNFFIEMLDGIHTVKALSMEEQLLRRYERLEQSHINDNYLMTQINASGLSIITFASHMNLILIVAFGSWQVIHDNLSIGGLAACTLLATRSIKPLSRAITLWERFQKVKLAIEDQNRLLSLKPDYCENFPDIGPIQGQIKLQNVSFRYSDAKECSVKKINLTINAGETIAITGPGFSGKTTLIEIIAGLLYPQQGLVFADDKLLMSHNIQSYRHQIAYIPKNGQLYKGTILENLTGFNVEEKSTQAIAFAAALGLNTYIEQMPNGYFTQVGFGTVDTISRGLTQGIVLVQALINNPKIILFDEANQAMDISSDEKLKQHFQNLEGITTIILVTHRPSLLKLANHVYEMTDGELTLRDGYNE